MPKNFFYSGLIILVIMTFFCLAGCAKEKKEANLEVVDSEFSIRKEDKTSYIIDAKGVIRNTGDVDVRNVEVTGYCKSCGEQIIEAQWFVSDYEKMAHQKDVIDYLPAGSTKEFGFKEVAFYAANRTEKAPEGMPEGLGISIDSYEVVE